MPYPRRGDTGQLIEKIEDKYLGETYEIRFRKTHGNFIVKVGDGVEIISESIKKLKIELGQWMDDAKGLKWKPAINLAFMGGRGGEVDMEELQFYRLYRAKRKDGKWRFRRWERDHENCTCKKKTLKDCRYEPDDMCPHGEIGTYHWEPSGKVIDYDENIWQSLLLIREQLLVLFKRIETTLQDDNLALIRQIAKTKQFALPEPDSKPKER